MIDTVLQDYVPDRDILVLVFDHCTPVMVYIQIVRSTEYRDHRRKLLLQRLTMHGVSRILCFMSAEYTQKLVALQELACSLVTVRSYERIYVMRSIGLT